MYQILKIYHNKEIDGGGAWDPPSPLDYILGKPFLSLRLDIYVLSESEEYDIWWILSMYGLFRV